MVCAIGLIEVFAALGLRLPNPTIVLLPLVIAAGLVGGLGSGLVAAVFSTLYYIYVNNVPGEEWWGQMAPRGWTAIIATTLIVPLAELGRRWFLAESDEAFRTMADNIAEIAWIGDEQGRIFWFNRRWYDKTGASLEETKGWRWQTLVRQDHVERVAAKSQHCFTKGVRWEDTFPLRAKDGNYHWFLARAVPVYNKRGQVSRWFGTNTDITAHLEVEEELQKVNDMLAGQVAERTAVAEGRADQLRHLVMELTNVEQRERGRLAQVLHDDLQQLLVGAKLQLALAVYPGGSRERVSAADHLISQAIEASRSLSKELAPPILYDQGLGAAIHWLAKVALQRYNLKVEVNADESGEAEGQWLRTLLFDTVRELLLNTAKHAEADRVRIDLTRAGGEVTLLYEDSGKGFEVESVGKTTGTGGSGLFWARQRVILIGGNVDIASVPGKGTRIRINVPLNTVAPSESGD